MMFVKSVSLFMIVLVAQCGLVGGGMFSTPVCYCTCAYTACVGLGLTTIACLAATASLNPPIAAAACKYSIQSCLLVGSKRITNLVDSIES